MDHSQRETIEKTLVDKWILDQYRIVKPIGSGGMGLVFLAEQAAMDRYAVVKILLDDPSRKDEMRQRFRREVRALSKLTHPNIVTVYAFGETADGLLVIAMEHVDGIPLEEQLAKGPISPDEAVDVALQCGRALAHAHTKQIVHRDFKPSNVMLTELSGLIHVKVLDFGIARLEEESNPFTRAGSLLGTPRYMSPEQCRGETASPLSDQYSLGLVLYEMLAGQPAMSAESTIGYLYMQQNFVPPPPSQLRQAPGLDLLDPIVMRMQAKEPAERFPSLEEVCEAIEAATPDLPRRSRRARGTSSLVSRSGSTTLSQETVDRQGSAGLCDTASESRRPARILALGASSLLTPEGWSFLEQRSIAVHKRLEEPASFRGQAAGDYDQCLLGLPGVCCDLPWNEWTRAGVPPHRTLVCIDAPLSSEGLVEQAGHFSNLLISPFPVDPVAVCIALSYMRRQGSYDGNSLLSDHPAEIVQILSSKKRTVYIESMLEDARTAGIRSSVLQKLRDIADEMITNAIFHAPIGDDGKRRYVHLDRSLDVTLRPDEDVTFRWTARDPYFILAVRDRFGSIPPPQILSHVTGPTARPRVGSTTMGTGVGLRLVSQSCRHLLFAISPGNWCEVVAFVDRHPSAGASKDRTLAVIQHSETKKQLGDRLSCVECKYERQIHIRLSGDVNETSDLSSVFRHTGTVWLDLSEVASVNSMGVRKWLEGAAKRDDNLLMFFKACSPAIVRQINMIPLFASTGHVHSLMAPYFCESCQAESLELLTTAEELYPPFRRCPRCAGELSFDDAPDEYFAFLKTLR